MPNTRDAAPALAYRFGVFEFNALTGELRKQGIRIRLQDQPCQILILLVRNAGELITREQIQKHLWRDNTFVDFDNAINTAVRKLRDTLGDVADSPRYIETLPRKGYRFVAPVTMVRDNPSPPEKEIRLIPKGSCGSMSYPSLRASLVLQYLPPRYGSPLR